MSVVELVLERRPQPFGTTVVPALERTVRTASAFSSALYRRVVDFPGDCSSAYLRPRFQGQGPPCLQGVSQPGEVVFGAGQTETLSCHVVIIRAGPMTSFKS